MAAVQTLELIKTLIASVDELRKEQAITSAQVTELYTMMTPRLDSLSSKLDMFDQKPTDLAPAKATVKKRTPVKKVVPDVEEEVEEPPAKAPVKKRVVKKSASAAVEEEPDAPVESDHEAPPSKPRGKKATVKPVASEAKPARDLNIIQYFNQEYAKDPKTFNLYLTESVKETIHEENANDLEGLKGADLAKKRQALYYHYVKDNYNPQLQAMKKAYLASEKAKSIKLLDADDTE